MNTQSQTLPLNDSRELLKTIADVINENERLRARVTDLLHGNNQYLERARRAERRVDELERFMARELA